MSKFLEKLGTGSNRGAMALALALALVAQLDALHYARSNNTGGLDFYQFWTIPQAIRDGEVGQLYPEPDRERLNALFLERSKKAAGSKISAFQAASQRGQAQLSDFPGVRQLLVAQQRKELEPYSSPFLYAVLSLFSYGEYENTHYLYQQLCLLLMIAAILMLCYTLRCSPLLALLAIAAFSTQVLFSPIASEIRVGNVNRIQLFGIAMFLLFRDLYRWRARDFISGLLLGLLVMFKPSIALVPLMLVASWLINRRIRRAAMGCAGMATGATVAMGLSGLYFGSMTFWVDWIRYILSIVSAPLPLSRGNVSLTALLHEAMGRDSQWLLLGALLVGILACFWLGRHRSSGADGPGAEDKERALHEEVLAVGMGLAIGLIAYRLTWLHYYILLIPMFLHAFRSAPGPSGLARQLVGILALLLMSPQVGQALGFSAFITVPIQLNLAAGALLLLALRDVSAMRHWASSSVVDQG